MFNKYRKCYCQNNYNPKVIENICNNIGTNIEYENVLKSTCNCGGNNNINTMTNDCECGFEEEESGFPKNSMLAQSYVPIQQVGKTFTPCCGLKMGTIFPELVNPYMPFQSMMENEYLRKTNKIGEECNK